MSCILQQEFADPECDPAEEEPLRYERIESKRGKGRAAEGADLSVAAWIEAHQDELIECDRHNGRIKLTAAACAERYLRARRGWVDSLRLHPDQRYILRLSFQVCASCPVGAYVARAIGRPEPHLQVVEPPRAASPVRSCNTRGHNSRRKGVEAEGTLRAPQGA